MKPHSDMPSTSSSVWLFIASPFSRVQQLQQFFLWVSAELWGEAGQTQPHQSCSLCSAWPHGWGADFIPVLPEIKDALSHPAMQRRRPVPLALAQTLLSSSCSVAEPIWRLPRAADGEPGQGSCSRNLLLFPFSLLTSLHSPRDGAWGQGSCCGSAWSFIAKIKLRRALRKAGILSRSCKASWDSTESSTELYE